MRPIAEVGAGIRLQLALVRRTPAQLLTLVTAPLFSVIFLSLAVHQDATSRVAAAVIGPGLMSMWLISLDVAASVLSEDRFGGRLELFLSTPASLSLVILGRILAVSVVGMLAFAESWLVARAAFGIMVPVRHPGLTVLALVVTVLSSSFTATLLASAFVLSRSLHVYQNSMSYPVYILGGVVVPLFVLPGWVQPVSKVVYLSWCSDLLRGSLAAPRVPDAGLDIAMALGLGVLALGAAVVLTQRILDLLRRNATAGMG
jgi:ABC-2 type transport system permease protein